MGNRTRLRVLSAVMALLISLTLALPVYAESTSGGLDEPASTVLPSDSEPGEGLEGSPEDGTQAPDGDDAADPGEAPGDSPSENPAPPPADDPAPPDTDDTLQAEAASKPVQLVGNGGLAALTDEMRAGKRQLAAGDVAGQLSRLAPDFHYVNHEVVYTTANKAEAELVAETYNGLLTSYEEGVAVIQVPADTLDVIEAAQDTANTYPPVYPNLVYVLDNSTLFSDSSIVNSLPGEDASEDETPPDAGPDDSTSPADSIAPPSGANPEPADPPVPVEDIVTMMDQYEVTQEDIDGALAAGGLEALDDSMTAQATPSAHTNAPNDDHIGKQWYHETLGTYDAWDIAKGAGIVVAVIDSGIAGGHPDLKANIKAKYNTSGHAINGTEDNSGHGTHVAGIIAAVANNKKGVAGVAPGAKLISIKALDYAWVTPTDLEAIGTTADIAQAVNLAVTKGANIINMSLSGPLEADDSLLEEAIGKAADAGVLMVVAAGNNSGDLNRIDIFPAEYDGVLTVSATDINDAFAAYSNYGAGKIDIAAPGGTIQYNANDEPIDPENGILSTYKAGGYAWMSGTSMATPVVAGVAALVMSSNASYKTKSPDTVAAVTKILQDSANSRVSGFTAAKYGAGLVDAAEAVGVVKDATIPDVTLSQPHRATLKTGANDTVGQYTLEVTPADSSRYNVNHYVYYYTTNGKAPTLASDKAQNTNEIVIPTNGKKSVTIKVAASDQGKLGKVATYSYTLSTSIASATLAAKSSISTVGVGKKLALTATFTPSKPSNAGLTWTSLHPDIATVNLKTGAVTGRAAGTATIRATTKAGQPDAPKNFDFEVTVRPATTGFVFKNLDGGANFTAITLATVAHNSLPTTLEFVPHALPYANADEAENALQGADNYAYKSSKPAVATVALSGGESKVVVTPVGHGTTTITVTARDGSGKSARLTVTVAAPAEIVSISNSQGQPTQSGDNIKFHVAAGRSINLTAMLSNPKTTNKKLNWVSDNPDKVYVHPTSGKVTAKGTDGDTAIITVTPQDGLLEDAAVEIAVEVHAGYRKTDKLDILAERVLNIYKYIDGTSYQDETALYIEPTMADIYDGFFQMTVPKKQRHILEIIEEEGAFGDRTTYYLIPKAKGKVTLTLKAVDGSNKKASVTIDVRYPVTSLEVTTPYETIARGAKVKCTATVFPADASNKKLKWSVDNPDDFAVDKNGVLTVRRTENTAGVASAYTTVIATATDGSAISNATNPVYSYGTPLAGVKWINLDTGKGAKSITMYEDDPGTWFFAQLSWYGTQSSPINEELVVTGGDDRIAGLYLDTSMPDPDTNRTLYLAYIYPNSPGTTTYTVKTLDGTNKSASLKVTVKPGARP